MLLAINRSDKSDQETSPREKLTALQYDSSKLRSTPIFSLQQQYVFKEIGDEKRRNHPSCGLHVCFHVPPNS